jgi:riboflavin biosynthesis pyrimidine reductase
MADCPMATEESPTFLLGRPGAAVMGARGRIHPVADDAKIAWHLNTEHRHPFGPVSPDPKRYDPVGFPPPWPDRPWIYGVMVASANGVVAWRRRDAADDPVRAVLGGDDTRRERIADRRLMRLLRCYGDVSIGAQTLRDQPRLVQTPQEPGEDPAPELYRFRTAHGLPYHPRTIVYSLFGRLPIGNPVFHTPGLDVIVITGERGADELLRRGDTGLTKIVEAVPDPEGLRRAHQRLFAEHGVRYLACEGGETILRALHAAGLLDEVFLTTTDAVIDTTDHDGVLEIMDLPAEGAALVAEGRVRPDSGWVFRRWRLNPR